MTDELLACPVAGCECAYPERRQLEGHIKSAHGKLDRDAKPDIEGVSACPNCDSCQIIWRKMTEDWHCEECDCVCGPGEIVDRASQAPTSTIDGATIRRSDTIAGTLDRMSVDEFDELTGGGMDE